MATIESFHAVVLVGSAKIKRNNPIVRKSLIHMARKQVSENPVVVSTGAAAAPVRRKSTAGKSTTKRATESAPTVEVSSTTTPTPVAVPTNEQIAHLAYSLWVARGCQGGSPEEDWLCAEQQLYAAYTK